MGQYDKRREAYVSITSSLMVKTWEGAFMNVGHTGPYALPQCSSLPLADAGLLQIP